MATNYNKIILLLIIFILSLVVVSATNYNNTGAENNKFLGSGASLLGQRSDNYASIWNAYYSNPQGLPIEADLANDGHKEIIVINKPNIQIYQNNTLSPYASIAIAG